VHARDGERVSLCLTDLTLFGSTPRYYSVYPRQLGMRINRLRVSVLSNTSILYTRKCPLHTTSTVAVGNCVIQCYQCRIYIPSEVEVEVGANKGHK